MNKSKIPQYRTLTALYSKKHNLSIEATTELYNLLNNTYIEGFNTGFDNRSSHKILEELMLSSKEVIYSPIRFDGVDVEKIKSVFDKYGCRYEPF